MALFLISKDSKQSKLPSIGEWLCLYVIWPYNGILLSNKKEYSIHAVHMGELQKYYVKWKKPDAKDYILYDFFYMKDP